MSRTSTLPTHGEARIAFDSILSSFSDSLPLSESELQTAFAGITNSLTIRDYALGAIGESIATHSDRFAFLNLFAICGESADIEAIKSAYFYEAEELQKAKDSLQKAFELNPSHSLSILLSRVFSAGWPSQSFVAMRSELHPKVIEQIQSDSALRVGGEE